MSFGNEGASKITEGTSAAGSLSSFLVSKMTQTRKKSRSLDKKKKKSKKEKQDKGPQTIIKLDKLISKVSSLKDIFAKLKKPKNGQAPKRISRPSGNSSGLAKILTNGFGGLALDTSKISGGLSTITQILNKSLQAQSFTATGVKNIVSVLTSQLQGQSSLISAVKSSQQRGGGENTKKSKFGNTNSGSAGGGDTLTGYLVQKAAEKGLFKAARDKLGSIAEKFLPKTPEVVAKAGIESAEAVAKKKLAQEITTKGLSSKGAIVSGKYISMTAAEAAATLASKPTGNMFTRMLSPLTAKLGPKGAGYVSRLIPGAQTAIGTGLAVKEISEGDEVGATLAASSALPGPIGWGFLAADIARELIGPNMFDKSFGNAIGGNTGFTDAQIEQREKTMSAAEKAMTTLTPSFSSGGVMLGEAGKEAVIDLNSTQGRGLVSQQKDDPGMKTSGASTLTIVDQFIKGLGALGAPVAQALGPDVEKLANTFGMSQLVPNLKLGGNNFTPIDDSKKNRDKFLEKLISGSLDQLGAKKKDDKKEETPPPPPPTPPPGSNPNRPNTPAAGGNPASGAGTPAGGGGGGKPPLDRNPLDRNPLDRNRSGSNNGVGYSPTAPGTHIGPGGQTKPTNQITLQIPNFDEYEVLSNRANGDFEIWKKGFLGLGGSPVKTGTGRDSTTGKFKDPLFAAAYNEVRSNYLNNAIDTGVTYGYITPEEWRKETTRRRTARVNGNQQRGGMVKESYQKGGRKVEKPWWDFLGMVTGAEKVREGTTGIYAETPMGRISETAAKKNKILEQLQSGYEKGGVSTVKFGSELDKEKTIEYRVKVLEDLLVATAAAITEPPLQNNVSTRPNTRNSLTSSSAPVMTTAQQGAADEMSSATIINLIGSKSTQIEEGGDGQSTNDYVQTPWPSGLAGVLCNSPWGV